MRWVPFLDNSGAIAIEDLINQCRERNINIIFSALQTQPQKIIEKLQTKNNFNNIFYALSYEEAINLAKKKT